MTPNGETGEIVVEYAMIAGAVILVFAAIMLLARADPVGGWLLRTRNIFFVNARLDDFKSLSREIQER